MNDDATMNELCGKYEGLTREECREEVIKDLEKLGLLYITLFSQIFVITILKWLNIILIKKKLNQPYVLF